MKAFCAALSLAGLLAALPASAAHKNIVISDSLVANADELKVKMGVQWLGIHKWRMGDYAVLSSKAKGTTTTRRSNKTKTDTRSGNSFAFVLGGATADSAFVSATHEMTAQSRREPGLKTSELVQELEAFTASIAINRDTSETWTLFMGGSTAPDQTGDYNAASAAYKTVLTHGEKTIVLRFASSRPELAGDKRPSFASQLKMHLVPPAMGYEFIENGQSVCAVQYFSEGLGGSNTFFVWMRRDVDAKSKLMLAAAMTAVLEMKCSVSGPALPDEE